MEYKRSKRPLGPRLASVAFICSIGLIACQHLPSRASCQGLPEDIQRELNANLAEQARIQAQRARHQQQIRARTGQAAQVPAAGKQQPHDPNNYSYQQVSPPVQYSYYQPYGDLAKNQPLQPGNGAAASAPTKPINIDLNNLNFDDIPNLPTPQAQTAANPQQRQQHQQHLTPSFTGAGGLPVMRPVAAAQQSPELAPVGQEPLAPQARVQQGPPLTEADFKDITGGENYGAPSGSDFGMGAANSANGDGGGGEGAAEPRSSSGDEDAPLREFGMPDGGGGAAPRSQGNSNSNPMHQMGLGDFGMGAGGGGARRSGGGGFDPFGGSAGGGMPFGDFGLGMGMGPQAARRKPAVSGGDGAEFDFASQPSQRSQGDNPAQATLDGAAPGSLQSLLGNAFPGLGGGNAANMGLDGLASGTGGQPEPQLNNQAGQQRADDGALDIADMGDRSDGFSGADLGDFEQPRPQADQDFNYAAAAEPQPKSVPYPDGGPQLVGTLWALSQPQSLSQTRYNPLPDKGTYQDYPAYQSGGNSFGAVQSVVEGTPRARATGPGRYAHPEPSELAPEFRGQGRMDYSRPPPGYGEGGANYEAAASQAPDSNDFL